MDDRRRLIADTALTVIGDGGIRALSHHRVDDGAGLARGSTSYYCRRRVDLLRLTLERLYMLDEADLRDAVARARNATPSHEPPTPPETRRAIAELVHGWLADDARARSIARIELFMAASHEPELQPLLGSQFAGLRQTALPLLTGGDAAAAQRFAAGFMLMDGLMLGVLREGLPAPTREQIEDLLAVLD